MRLPTALDEIFGELKTNLKKWDEMRERERERTTAYLGGKVCTGMSDWEGLQKEG